MISPLKALMADQLEAATTAGIPAMALTAETPPAERESVFAQLVRRGAGDSGGWAHVLTHVCLAGAARRRGISRCG